MLAYSVAEQLICNFGPPVIADLIIGAALGNIFLLDLDTDGQLLLHQPSVSSMPYNLLYFCVTNFAALIATRAVMSSVRQ